MTIARVLARLAAALVLVVGGAAVAAQPAPGIEGAAAVRQKLAGAGRISVIAKLAPAAGKALEGVGIEAARQKLARDLAPAGVREVRPLGSLPFVALEVSAAELAALERSGAVAAVSENTRLRRTLMSSAPQIAAPVAWGKGVRGGGAVVVIVDDGIDGDHPFLQGRVVRSVCSAPDCGAKVVDRAGAGEPCRQGCTHGTHVAGIAAGRGRSFSGIAPDARLISVRVFGPEADWEHLIRGLDYVATELAGRYPIAAVNMSLGDGTRQAAACDREQAAYEAVAAAVDRLKRLGIATVASSGNDGYKSGVSAPACIADVIAVGSVGRADRPSAFSNRGTLLDLLAPGESIYASIPGGGFARYSGTSMAAPHVAGAFALLRGRFPKASVDRIEQALEATGKPTRSTASEPLKPRLDVAKALARLGG